MGDLWFVIFSVLLNVGGQLSMKQGMNNYGEVNFGIKKIPQLIVDWATNPLLILGIFLYAVSAFFWLVGLSKVDLSLAYPMLSLGYAVVVLASWLLFQENITPLRLTGVIVIIGGVILISRT